MEKARMASLINAFVAHSLRVISPATGTTSRKACWNSVFPMYLKHVTVSRLLANSHREFGPISRFTYYTVYFWRLHEKRYNIRNN